MIFLYAQHGESLHFTQSVPHIIYILVHVRHAKYEQKFDIALQFFCTPFVCGMDCWLNGIMFVLFLLVMYIHIIINWNNSSKSLVIYGFIHTCFSIEYNPPNVVKFWSVKVKLPLVTSIGGIVTYINCIIPNLTRSMEI